MHARQVLVAAALTVLVTGFLGGCKTSSSSISIKTSTSGATATTTPTTPKGPKTSFGPGKYKVGVDIAPGNYATDGPSDTSLPNCYWARERNNSGDFSAIITNDTPAGPTSVTVNAGEYFETSGCKTWHKQ